MVAIGDNDIFFSIIMPVYNTKKYVEKSIKSVLQQTYDHFELIIVDDGSTDGSEKICDMVAKEDPRIKVVHKKNEGQGCARNVAIECSSGEYIIFLDSDDWLATELIEYLARIIRKYYPELIIYSFLTCNQRTATKMYNNPQISNDTCETFLNEENLWKEYLENEKIGGMVWNKCIARRTISENNLKFPVIRAREDSFFLSELFKHVKYAVLSNYIGYYQMIRYGSVEQNRYNADFLISIYIRENALKFIDQTYPQLHEKAYKALLQVKINAIKLIIADGKASSFKNEINIIKNGLLQDVEEIDKKEICKTESELIKEILSNSTHWKWECLVWGVKKHKNNIKRFLYDKFF